MMDLGVDLNANWEFNENGDLITAKNEDNLLQSIINRLSCGLNELYFYNYYGSLLYGFLGWRKDQKTLEFMKIEINNALEQDPRLNKNKFDVDVSYGENGDVLIYLNIAVDSNQNLDFNLVLNKNTGVVKEAE